MKQKMCVRTSASIKLVHILKTEIRTGAEIMKRIYGQELCHLKKKPKVCRLKGVREFWEIINKNTSILTFSYIYFNFN